MFSKEESKRYRRHFLLPAFGSEGQERLRRSSVLVIGAGGLGCPALVYLCAAGVGKIGIVDHDSVELSNLQRQVLFTVADIGLPKALCAAARLRETNPHPVIVPCVEKASQENIFSLIEGYDLVIDGTDNFPARYLINDACAVAGKPLVYGSVYRFEGQVSVFFSKDRHGIQGPGYRDLFPVQAKVEGSADCANAGVLGVLPGIIGTLQACEAIKVLAAIGEPLRGRLLTLNALTMEFSEMEFGACTGEGQSRSFTAGDVTAGTYGTACVQQAPAEISALELRKLLKVRGAVTVVDVRDEDEWPDAGTLADLKIPLYELTAGWKQIPSHKPVIVFCKSGARSKQAVALLRSMGMHDVRSLGGGLQALEADKEKEPI